MKDFEKIDQLLWQVISSDIEPKDSLNQKIIHMAKEKEKDKNIITKRFSTIALCAILIVVSSMTVFAAWQLLTPKQIAEGIGNKGLAIAFESEDALFIDQECISGDYKVTLIGIVSGKGLSDVASLVEETKLDKSYVVVAIAKMDGTKMPELKDLEYDEVPFFVSPFIKGLDPKTYNIFTMNGGYSERIIEGVLYRIIECNDVEIFADRGLYIGVTSSKFYDIHAYDFDAVTGEITANLDYQGVNILFDLPIDPSKGNQEKAEKYLQSSFDLVKEEELTVNEYERIDANYKDIVYDHESFA